MTGAGPGGLRLGLVTGMGGLGDRAFNDMQYNGMILARKKFGIPFEYVAPKAIDQVDQDLAALIQRGCNVVFAASSDLEEPIDKYARLYPGIHFILLDGRARTYAANVASISFRQNEGSFLAGALAAQMSRTKKIGFIGGVDIPPINDFLVGYQAGARFIDREVTVTVRYVAQADSRSDPWANPKLARTLALELIDHGTDIVFSVAAASNIGIFQAAKARRAYAIGVDMDQDYLVKGAILTSMMKRLDLAIVFMVEKLVRRQFENRAYTLGLKDNAVGLSPMSFTRDRIPAGCLERLEEIRTDIIAGKIVVPTTMGK